MSIKPDHWIRRMALDHGMIEPFVEAQVRDGVISYGLSSYGYDMRVADEFKVFTNVFNVVVDPKNFSQRSFVDIQADYCDIPPNSFALTRSVELFRIPRKVACIVMGKCVTGDTRVVNASTGAYLPIRDVVHAGKTLAFVDNQLAAMDTSAVIYQGNQQVYRLCTRSGRTIRATATHPFFTASGWKPLHSLQVGTPIAVARTMPVFGNEQLPEWEAALLGFMIAEGQCLTPGHSPVFTSSDPVLINAVTEYAHVGLNSTVTSNGVYGYRLTNRSGRGGVMTANRASQWLAQYGLTVHAYDKFVPQAVFLSNQESTATFLRALFSGDGSIYRNPNNGLVLEYSSSSERLIDDVQHLLLRFGMLSNKRIKHPTRGRTAYVLKIHNSATILSFARQIGFWPGSVKQQRLEAMLPILENRVTQRSKGDYVPAEAWALAEMGLEQRSFHSVGVARRSQGMDYAVAQKLCQALPEEHALHTLASDAILWDPIQSITDDGIEEVYDLNVPVAHNFVANNIIIHNSTYARCGIIINVTPLEPEWVGHITIEISNTTPLPARIYANEGIGQVLFLESDEECQISYADKKGKYQQQQGIVLPYIEEK